MENARNSINFPHTSDLCLVGCVGPEEERVQDLLRVLLSNLEKIPSP